MSPIRLAPLVRDDVTLVDLRLGALKPKPFDVCINADRHDHRIKLARLLLSAI